MEEEGNGKADDGGDFTGKEGGERVVVVLDAVGAGFSLPEVGVEVGGELGWGEFFELDGGDGAGEADVGGGEEAEAGDDLVGVAGERREDMSGVGTVAGFVHNLTLVNDDGVGGEDEGWGIFGF